VIRGWQPAAEEKGQQWLCSKLTSVVNGALRWNKEEKRSMEEIPPQQLQAFAREVEYCIRSKAATVTQGAHDKYVQYCVNCAGKPQTQIGGGSSLYVQGLRSLHGIAGTPIDKVAGVKDTVEAAQTGVPEAISLLGYCYEHGDGVDENKSRASVVLSDCA